MHLFRIVFDNEDVGQLVGRAWEEPETVVTMSLEDRAQRTDCLCQVQGRCERRVRLFDAVWRSCRFAGSARGVVKGEGATIPSSAVG